MSAKLKRQNVIKEILLKNVVSTHEEMIALLRKEFIHVTQATLSRDFAEMGVIRTFAGSTPKYSLNPDESGRKISKLISFEIVSVEHNESLIVVRTLAGRAQGVAHYIDRLNVREILGTVGGDDTLLVIPDSKENLQKVVNFLKELMIDKI